MFDNIKSLILIKDPNEVAIATAMVSAEGEIMEFRYNGIFLLIIEYNTFEMKLVCSRDGRSRRKLDESGVRRNAKHKPIHHKERSLCVWPSSGVCSR